MRLTKQTNHAIRILVHCAGQRDQLLKVAEIAGDLDITQQNVFKIVHLLTRSGFLKAMRGRHGGVRLARPPVEIRIGDVVRATESTRMAIDDDDATVSQKSRQPINHVFDSALEAFISVLDQHTLEDMAKGARVASPAPVRKSASRGSPLLKPLAAAPSKSRTARQPSPK